MIPKELLRQLRSIEIRTQRLADETGAIEDRAALAMAHARLGSMLRLAGAHADAIVENRRAVALQEDVFAQAATKPHALQLADCLNRLGNLVTAEKEPVEAERAFRRVRKVIDPTQGPVARRELGLAEDGLAWIFLRAGREPLARGAAARAAKLWDGLVREFPAVPFYYERGAATHNRRSFLESRNGNKTEAEELIRNAVAIQDRLVELNDSWKDRARLATYLCNMATLFGDRPEVAVECSGRALAILDAIEAPAAATREKTASGTYGGNYHKVQSSIPDVDWQRGYALQVYAGSLENAGRLRDAIPLLERRAARRSERAEHHKDLARVYALVQDRTDEDLRRANEAIARARAAEPENQKVQAILGLVRYRLGEHAGAIAATQGLEGKMGARANAIRLFVLAMSRWQTGDEGGARDALAKALAWYQEKNPGPVARILRDEAAALIR